MRRTFLRVSAVISAGLIFGRGDRVDLAQAVQQGKRHASARGEKQAKGSKVTATEDLMREHGVLRRALLVYTAAAGMLRRDPSTLAPEALQKTARLFRTFGEDYHEKKLEETYLFPAVKRPEVRWPACPIFSSHSTSVDVRSPTIFSR
jgi:hypothetical protein